VISMRHSLVTASRTMLMRRLVSACPVLGPAAVGIVSGDLQDVLLYAIAFYVLQVSVFKIVNVIFVSNRDMPAAWTMGVRAIGVSRHGFSLDSDP
jgi:Mn2+/Fe2+ NRAMP family transporter